RFQAAERRAAGDVSVFWPVAPRLLRPASHAGLEADRPGERARCRANARFRTVPVRAAVSLARRSPVVPGRALVRPGCPVPHAAVAGARARFLVGTAPVRGRARALLP